MHYSASSILYDYADGDLGVKIHMHTTITDLASSTCRLSCLVSAGLPRGAQSHSTTLASGYLDWLQLEIPLTIPDPTYNSRSFGAHHSGDLVHQRNVSKDTKMTYCVECRLHENEQLSQVD